MAIASPSTPNFSASFYSKYSKSHSSARFSTVRCHRTNPPFQKSSISSRLNSSKPSNGYTDSDGDLQYEYEHGASVSRQPRKGRPVFVALPSDSVTSAGKMRRRKVILQSLRALAAAGVEGIVMEVWWGMVERDVPEHYDWQAYEEIVSLAEGCGLKVRAVMAFHQRGTGPGDPLWIPLPQWVLEEMERDPEISFSDRLGRRNKEYISLGCDLLPVLYGRSPIQAYSDFMRNFRDVFRRYLGVTITGIQVGMGPSGELRYPSCSSHNLTWARHIRELGDFQCYDKYLLSSLNASGKSEWANRSPENTDFFDNSRSSHYGDFFLKWYSNKLLSHGERICREVESIFHGIEINTSAKIGAIDWHYYVNSEGYLPIAQMFSRYRFGLCCTSFEVRDSEEQDKNPISSPEGFLRQLILAARVWKIPFEGENSSVNLDDGSFKQIVKMSDFYCHGVETASFSFNFVRMDRNLFEPRQWMNFTRFVKQMSDGGVFRARLEFGGVEVASNIMAAIAY
ncbi:beta-amylase 1, chloroplastic-like [Impatiens glandulifera]|uniref:beta-amylase 1, chloroplastic-like n=1 Tax=Impatiens glandulifera TaxID=253017 RepID=UPI001FB0A00D|nr:beta-amylase 1, chloroplastic-like [Impatiens glandulifera]